MGKRLALFENEAFELLDSQLGHQKFDAGTGAISLFTKPGEDAGDGLSDRQQFLCWDELVEQLCLVGHGPQAAPDIQLEASLLHAVDDAGRGDGAEIMHVRQAAGLVLAAREGRLELATKILHVWVTEKELRKRLRVRRNIEGLGVADAGQGTGSHIAHGVPASLARRNAGGGKPAHEIDRIVDVDVVELHILSGRDVDDVIRIFFGQVGESIHLLSRQAHRKVS